MVVFAGPHKSASSSVQELFMKYAGTGPEGKLVKHPSLQHWTWPWNPRRRSYLPRKGFAPLVTEEIGFHRLIWDTILQVWNATDAENGEFQNPNLIWGTEELDRFGTTPWSGRNGLEAIQKVWNLTRPELPSLDIVVNYRRPHRDQWISIWKQLMRKEEDAVEYKRFLCDPEEYLRIWEYLDCVANPLGLVQALLDFWDAERKHHHHHHHGDDENKNMEETLVTIHLLDMKGVADMKRDVGHVIACDVLGVECTADHWLPDVERPILQNAKSGNPGLTAEQMEEIEWVLRQRDCSYRARLQEATTHHDDSTTRLVLHYADTLWDTCPPPSNTATGNTASFANTTFLLDLLQSQLGCGSFRKKTISRLMRQQRQQQEGSSTVEDTVQSKKNHRPQRINSPLLTTTTTTAVIKDDPHSHLVETAKAQLLVMYALLVLMIGVLIRRLKCSRRGGYVAQRRLAGRHHLKSRIAGSTR